MLRNQLVLLAEAVNSVAIRGIKTVDVNTTRQVLLAIDDLAQDEEAGDKRMPSTRALARLQPTRGVCRKRA